MITTTLTALLSSLKSSTPVQCPVCGGTGGSTCIDCNGTGMNSSFTASGGSESTESDREMLSRSVSYNFNDNDKGDRSKRKGSGESRTALGIVGRNPRECQRCLG